MTFLLLSLACAVDSDSVDSTAVLVEDPLVAEEADTGEAVVTPVVTRDTTLSLTVPSGSAAFYEIRAYALVEGELWAGLPLAEGAIAADNAVVGVTLPRLAPRSDRNASPDGAVAYALALRDAGPDGAPGAYTGLAKERLVYIHRNAPVGASIGWNLASGDEESPTWLPLADGVVLEENLVGGPTLTLGGHSTVEVGPGTHLALTTLDGAASPYDFPIAPDWSVTIPGAPPFEALGEDAPVPGAVFAIQAYQDLGADNRWTDEPVLGEGCLGLQEVRVTWFDAPYDLVDALAMEEAAARAGWSLAVETEGGRLPVSADAYDALVLAAGCDES